MMTFKLPFLSAKSKLFLLLLLLLLLALFIISINDVACAKGKRRQGEVDIDAYREKVKRMFYHAYEGYLRYAYPYDELKPLTCKGHDTWGSYSLTLIDAMDTLAVMGNYSEFRRIANLVIDKGENAFDMDINVSVFETNIRIVGGLISAHLLMKRAGMELEEAWPCSGPLLRMADSIARKLLPAFDTPTGMPYGTVSLRNGVPKGETTVTCTAGVGTFMIEFGTLSRLTGDPIFEKTAVRAIRSLWKYRSPLGLLGNHIDVKTGKWTALDAGIGGGVDSYFEYLVKGSILFNLPELVHLFREYEVSIKKYLKKDDWYMWAQMTKGTITLPMFTSLDAFWPSIQMMLGDVDAAMKTLQNFHMVWRQFGFTPEYYNIPKAEVHKGREGYPLRPELIESIMYLYRATKDPLLLQMGVDIYESIEREARTSCGYATIKDVQDHRLEDRMESFFLSETTKYLYLLFDQDNFIHNNGSHGQVINTPSGSCVIEASGYVFNTEAHPIDLAAVHCCSAKKQEEDKILEEFHSNLDLLSLLNLVEDDDDFGLTDWRKSKKKTSKSHSTTDDKPLTDDVDIDAVKEKDIIQKVLKVDLAGEIEKAIKERLGEIVEDSGTDGNELRKEIGVNLEALRPAGPTKAEESKKSDTNDLKENNILSTEKSVARVLMDTINLDVNEMNSSELIDKLQSKFKATKYEKIAGHLVEKLLKEEGVGKQEIMEKDGNKRYIQEDDHQIPLSEDTNTDDNGEALINFLSELKDVMSELESDSNKITAPVEEKTSDKNAEEIRDNDEEKSTGSESNENKSGQKLPGGERLSDKEGDKDEKELSVEEELNPGLQKLRDHLETQIKQDEEKEESVDKQTPLVKVASGLENRRENLLSLTKKVLMLFSSLSSGKLESSDGTDGGEIFTKDSPSIGNLYASLAKHSLSYFDDPYSMHCPVRPFHQRLSVHGEFFVDE